MLGRLIDAARTGCGAGSMKRSSVRLSVSLSRRSTAATAIGGFAAERFAGRRYRSIAAAAARHVGRVNRGPGVRRSNILDYALKTQNT